MKRILSSGPFFAALFVAVAATPALAADADTTVSVAPLLTALVEAGVAVIPVAATALMLIVKGYLKSRLNIDLDDQARMYVQDAADRAAQWAAAHLDAKAAGLTVDLHNATLATGVGMVMTQVPDGLARLGVDRQGVEHMLTTRLAALGVLPPASAVPATPSTLPATGA